MYLKLKKRIKRLREQKENKKNTAVLSPDNKEIKKNNGKIKTDKNLNFIRLSDKRYMQKQKMGNNLVK